MAKLPIYKINRYNSHMANHTNMTNTSKTSSDSTDNDGKVDFGFKKVTPQQKTDRVKAVFHSVASRYDRMNDLMSFGIHRLWKRYAIDQLGSYPGQTVLDLASGSGDMATLLLKRVGQTGKVIASDINPVMLAQAKRNLLDQGIIDNIEYVEANAEKLPFPDHHVDAVTIAFGLRNITSKEKALSEMYRVLKSGGRLLILEFSKAQHHWWQKLYDAYSFNIIPKLGKLFANDEDSYRYLVESIRMHPDQQQLKQMTEMAGFEKVHYHNLGDGIVAVHIGDKPNDE